MLIFFHKQVSRGRGSLIRSRLLAVLEHTQWSTDGHSDRHLVGFCSSHNGYLTSYNIRELAVKIERNQGRPFTVGNFDIYSAKRITFDKRLILLILFFFFLICREFQIHFSTCVSNAARSIVLSVCRVLVVLSVSESSGYASRWLKLHGKIWSSSSNSTPYFGLMRRLSNGSNRPNLG